MFPLPWLSFNHSLQTHKKMNQKYIDIINEMATEKYGEGIILCESNSDDTRLHISIKLKISTYHVFSFRTKDGKYLLEIPDLGKGFSQRGEIGLDCFETFKTIVNEVFDSKCTLSIIEFYQKYCIDVLPKCIPVKDDYDLTLITADIITELFNEAADDVLNGETVETITVSNDKNKVVFNFSVDCGRSGTHKYNSVIINKRGDIDVTLANIIEGCGIERHIIEKLKEHFEGSK